VGLSYNESSQGAWCMHDAHTPLYLSRRRYRQIGSTLLVMQTSKDFMNEPNLYCPSFVEEVILKVGVRRAVSFETPICLNWANVCVS
jgi:hypothetical protein